MQVEYRYANEGHFAPIYALAQQPQTSFVYSGGGDGHIIRWSCDNPNQGEVWAQIPDKIFYLYASVSHLFVATLSGEIFQIPFEYKKVICRRRWHKKPVFRLLEWDNRLLAVSADGLLSEWSLPDLEWKAAWQISVHGLRSLSHGALGKILFIGDRQGNIYQYAWPQMELLNTAKNIHQGTVFSLYYHEKKDICISGGLDAMLKFHRWSPSFKIETALNAHWFAINDMKAVADNYLVTASRDKTIRMWHLESGQLIKDFSSLPARPQQFSVNTLCWLESEKTLFSAGDDRVLHAWKINDSQNDTQRQEDKGSHS